jgi:UDP-N-acetylglucosamine 2-epimerase (non-hydrolysing)
VDVILLSYAVVYTIDLIAGARPNFVKLAPVVHALKKAGTLAFRIIHTGQHYDPTMNDVFFAELDIPRPDVHLEVGSGTHGAQTARILERYEQELMRHRPDATVVFGDVNSTVACALAAVKVGVPVAHVEAGLRSFDRAMPEEINRILTDAISGLLLTTEESAHENLLREGADESRIRLVGNVMIDTLFAQLAKAREQRTIQRLGIDAKRYGFITLHRPSNVDEPAVLERLFELFEDLSRSLPLVFPLHPRTRRALEKAGIDPERRRNGSHLTITPPLSYLDSLSVMAGAAVVLTDSGGLQEETSVLNIPCLTMRNSTERPVTIECGTSRLVGNDSVLIREGFEAALRGHWPPASGIPFWDGQSAARIVSELSSWIHSMNHTDAVPRSTGAGAPFGAESPRTTSQQPVIAPIS